MNENKDTIKNRIFASAQELFAVKGYDAVGVAEICLKASASKGAFYHHFESKESLFIELLDEWLKKMDANLMDIFKNNMSLEEGISKVLEILKDLAVETTSQYPIFLEFYTKAIRSEEVFSRLDLEMKKYQNLLATLIQKGIDEKMLKPIDALSTSKIAIALVMGLLMEGWMSREKKEWNMLFKYSLNNFMEGIKK
jgi:AcrR family transcriptional regulator